MCIQNKVLFTKEFWASFNGLMQIKELKIKDKLNLVKVKKILTEHYKEVLLVVKDSQKKEDIEVLMKEDYNFNLKKIDIAGIEDKLSSSDIHNLEFLFKELNYD